MHASLVLDWFHYGAELYKDTPLVPIVISISYVDLARFTKILMFGMDTQQVIGVLVLYSLDAVFIYRIACEYQVRYLCSNIKPFNVAFPGHDRLI